MFLDRILLRAANLSCHIHEVYGVEYGVKEYRNGIKNAFIKTYIQAQKTFMYLAVDFTLQDIYQLITEIELHSFMAH